MSSNQKCAAVVAVGLIVVNCIHGSPEYETERPAIAQPPEPLDNHVLDAEPQSLVPQPTPSGVNGNDVTAQLVGQVMTFSVGTLSPVVS
jgi:hypothetical protein